MKLETGNWKLTTGRSRSGVALVVTLTIMALLLILATAFVVNMRGERAVATNYRRQVEARQAALAGLHAAIGKMNSFYAYAESVGASVQTMGGRFYYTNGTSSLPTKTLTTGISATVPLNTNMLMFSCTLADQLYSPGPNGSTVTNVADKVNMNVGSYNFTAPLDTSKQQADYYLPIANPSVHTSRKWNSEKVGVWAGKLTVNRASFAFWVDDESSKINISNAAKPNLAPLAYDNNFFFSDYANRVGYYPVVTPPPPLYAALFQSSTRQISSVDLAVLDYRNFAPADAPFPSQQNWSDSTTLTSIENARNAGTWPPFLAPDEVLGLPNNNVTMQDYQAVKPCLTAWSVENEDRAQLFRTNTTAGGGTYPMVARYNVGVDKAISSPLEAKKLYDFMMTSCDLANSASLKKFFNNASFKAKYPDTTLSGTNGSVNQIAANIVSYITDTTKTPPYGAGGSTIPTAGYCGLWKSAYMNEIAFSFYWQKRFTPKVPPATADTTQYQLWAAMYVELINPYEIDMPRSSSEYYTIDIDPDNPGSPPISFQVTWAPPPPSPPPAFKALPAGSLYTYDVVNKIKAHSYSSPGSELNADASPVPWIKLQWPITDVWTFPIDPKKPNAPASPPSIQQISIRMPKAIRMTMHKSNASGIIDWFDRSQASPNLANLILPQANCALISVVDVGALIGSPLKFSPPDPPPAADATFWSQANKTRISIAKNDPRVHKWYGVRTPGGTSGITGHGDVSLFGVTIKLTDAGGGLPGLGDNNGQNPLGNLNADGSGGIVDFRAGDVETQDNTYAPYANKPEYRSNFVIAERGMKSIGELGFIHTGKPWRSLSLQRYGAQLDEQIPPTTPNGPPTNRPKPSGYDQTVIPDWAILDLFTVNTPPIYGRVNINNGGWHLGSYTAGIYIFTPNVTFEDPTVEPQRPNLVADWRDAIGQWYGGVGQQWPFYTLRTSAYNLFRYAVMSSVVYSQKDTASLPVAAALNVIPQYQFRNMLANYITHRATNVNQNASPNVRIMDPYKPFVSVAEICEIPCMTNHFTGFGLVASGSFAPDPVTNPIARTDADKEDTVRRIINVLTTHGDAFTVHVIGNADGGEARLMAVVERVYDPAATQIIDKNKFRIRQVRWNSD